MFESNNFKNADLVEKAAIRAAMDSGLQECLINVKVDGGSCHGYAGNGDKTRMTFARYLISDLSVYSRVTGFTVVTPGA